MNLFGLAGLLKKHGLAKRNSDGDFSTVPDMPAIGFVQQNTEVSYMHLMHALVRIVKPNFIVEVGSFRGIASFFLADALKQNGSGRLLAIEPDDNVNKIAKGIRKKHGLEKHWMIEEGKWQDVNFFVMCDLNPIDFAFIDVSDKESFLDIFKKIKPYLAKEWFVVSHDTGDTKETAKYKRYMDSHFDCLQFDMGKHFHMAWKVK